MERRSYNAGEAIFQAGEPSDFAYLIITGSVEARLANGRSVLLKKGEVFGEMGLVDQRPRSATIIAKEYAVCAAYTEAELLSSIREAPDEAILLIRALIGRLREANKTI
ncbi:MAG: cyclic nucleotide-binding domain-containing protein [Rhizobiaceae bacterium]